MRNFLEKRANKKGFTLAEALITLGIIGVVAAVTIPAVVVNVNQQEYKTGLKKAVNSLNSSISLNLALDGQAPEDATMPLVDTGNSWLNSIYAFSEYFQRRMSVVKSTTLLPFVSNIGFYTTDGIRYEIPTGTYQLYSHETKAKENINNYRTGTGYGKGCGNRGFTTGTPIGQYPCLVLVDVNGDKKPNPANPNSNNNVYTYSKASDTTLKDVFLVLITNNKAIPYGVAAQRAMYSGD